MKKFYAIFVILMSCTMIFGQSKKIALDQDPSYKPINVLPSPSNINDIKWEETFNSTTPPAGWNIVDNDGSGSAWEFRQVVAFTSGDTVYPQVGQSFWFSNFNNANSNGLIDEWIISPQLPMVESGDSLYFWAGAIDAGYDDSLKVWVSTTDTALASFTQIGYFKVDGPVGTWHKYGFDLSAFSGHQVYVAVNYYIVDGGPSGNYSDNVWVDHFIMTGAGGGGIIPISQAIEDLNGDYVPDHLGDTVTVQGVVSSPDYNTGNFNYVIWDGTAGVTTILFGYTGPEYNEGDMLQITGTIGQYNGLTQLEPLDDASVTLESTGNALPNYMVMTLAQYFADPEAYEGTLVAFASLNPIAGQTWPSSGSNANFIMTDGTDTVTIRIDKETNIDDNPEPTWPRDVIGFGSQFDNSTPPDGGYQILPRSIDDFPPANTVPVELTSFSADINGSSVVLNWKTATETNNDRFEIQRKSAGEFVTVGNIKGQGTSTQPHEYSFTDQNLTAGEYYYRLKQVDFNGSASYSKEVDVHVAPNNFSLEQNYPNPFNPSTVINFNLSVDSKVTLNVYNVLGQKVAQLLNNTVKAGSHQVNFKASNLSSGVYFYQLDAKGINGQSFSSVKKMILTK